MGGCSLRGICFRMGTYIHRTKAVNGHFPKAREVESVRSVGAISNTEAFREKYFFKNYRAGCRSKQCFKACHDHNLGLYKIFDSYTVREWNKSQRYVAGEYHGKTFSPHWKYRNDWNCTKFMRVTQFQKRDFIVWDIFRGKTKENTVQQQELFNEDEQHSEGVLEVEFKLPDCHSIARVTNEPAVTGHIHVIPSGEFNQEKLDSGTHHSDSIKAKCYPEGESISPEQTGAFVRTIKALSPRKFLFKNGLKEIPDYQGDAKQNGVNFEENASESCPLMKSKGYLPTQETSSIKEKVDRTWSEIYDDQQLQKHADEMYWKANQGPVDDMQSKPPPHCLWANLTSAFRKTNYFRGKSVENKSDEESALKDYTATKLDLTSDEFSASPRAHATSVSAFALNPRNGLEEMWKKESTRVNKTSRRHWRITQWVRRHILKPEPIPHKWISSAANLRNIALHSDLPPLRHTDELASHGWGASLGMIGSPGGLGAFSPLLLQGKVAEAVAAVERLAEGRRRMVMVLAIIAAGCTVALFMRWESLRKRMGQEGAGVLTEGMRSPELQFTAAEFSKQLIDQILSDQRLQQRTGVWLSELMNREEVHRSLSTLALQLLDYLSKNEEAQTSVSNLLVQAINLPYAKESAAWWICEVLSWPSVTDAATKFCVEEILNSNWVYDQFVEKLNSATVAILQSPDTSSATRELLKEVIEDRALQTYLSDVLWSVLKGTVQPRWLGPRNRRESSPSSGGDSCPTNEIQQGEATQTDTNLVDMDKAVVSALHEWLNEAVDDRDAAKAKKFQELKEALEAKLQRIDELQQNQKSMQDKDKQQNLTIGTIGQGRMPEANDRYSSREDQTVANNPLTNMSKFESAGKFSETDANPGHLSLKENAEGRNCALSEYKYGEIRLDETTSRTDVLREANVIHKDICGNDLNNKPREKGQIENVEDCANLKEDAFNVGHIETCSNLVATSALQEPSSKVSVHQVAMPASCSVNDPSYYVNSETSRPIEARGKHLAVKEQNLLGQSPFVPSIPKTPTPASSDSVSAVPDMALERQDNCSQKNGTFTDRQRPPHAWINANDDNEAYSYAEGRKTEHEWHTKWAFEAEKICKGIFRSWLHRIIANAERIEQKVLETRGLGYSNKSESERKSACAIGPTKGVMLEQQTQQRFFEDRNMRTRQLSNWWNRHDLANVGSELKRREHGTVETVSSKTVTLRSAAMRLSRAYKNLLFAEVTKFFDRFNREKKANTGEDPGPGSSIKVMEGNSSKHTEHLENLSDDGNRVVNGEVKHFQSWGNANISDKKRHNVKETSESTASPQEASFEGKNSFSACKNVNESQEKVYSQLAGNSNQLVDHSGNASLEEEFTDKKAPNYEFKNGKERTK